MLETTKKEIEQILKTSKYSTKRAHHIENLVDSYISLIDVNDFDESDIQMVDDIQAIKTDLKQTNSKDYIYYLLVELKKVIIETVYDCIISIKTHDGSAHCSTIIDYERCVLGIQTHDSTEAYELFINYLEKGALQWNTYLSYR